MRIDKPEPDPLAAWRIPAPVILQAILYVLALLLGILAITEMLVRLDFPWLVGMLLAGIGGYFWARLLRNLQP